MKKQGIILFDVVLGYGAHEDMVGAYYQQLKKRVPQPKKQDVIFTLLQLFVGRRKIRKITNRRLIV